MSQHDFDLVRSYATAGGRVPSFFREALRPYHIAGGSFAILILLIVRGWQSPMRSQVDLAFDFFAECFGLFCEVHRPDAIAGGSLHL